MTRAGQKLCVVVYPQMDSKDEDVSEETKEQRAPIYKPGSEAGDGAQA